MNIINRIFLVFSLTIICPFQFVLPKSSFINTFIRVDNYFNNVNTDKARYFPGDTVNFNIVFNNQMSGASLLVKYFHLSDKIFEQTIALNQVSNVSWNWKTPQYDFRGYLVEIFLIQGNQTVDQTNIAVDVSSTWNYYPRYGFLSNYPSLSQDSIQSIIETLNRYHIDGIQFYDWQYKHNMPLDGTPQDPAPYWNDIANRTVYFSTVKGFIDEAHKFNIKTMAYNLLYGAYSNAYLDGVPDQWGLYKDTNHQNRWMYSLPSGWASNLYFMDPSNKGWQAYIFSQEKKVFEALPFDGWHVDQVGDPGTVYNYQGQSVNVANSFRDFLQTAKDSLSVPLVMNAVNQYGQSSILQAPVDFLYTEVWDPNTSFSDLINIIVKNNTLSHGNLKTVLAAYVNYNLSNNPGFFNIPGVLFLDAAIFAAGAFHIELGEHMLGNEYFPNNNLRMSDDLQRKLINYYDFMVAYENLLRDSVSMKEINIASTSNYHFSFFPPVQGNIWYLPYGKGNKDIIHFINFVKANSMGWRDANGTQTAPDTLLNIQITAGVAAKVSRVWLASPDFEDGSPEDLSFTQQNDSVIFIIPKLNYWDMVVIEYSDGATSINNNSNKNNLGDYFKLQQNYPNPFNPETTIDYQLPFGSQVVLKVYDILGNNIATLVNKEQRPGNYEVKFNSQLNKNNKQLASGIYFYTIQAGDYIETKKLVLLK